MTVPKRKAPSHTAEKFVVRLPAGFREKLKVKAKENHRAMNSEIVHAIEKHLGDDFREVDPGTTGTDRIFECLDIQPWNPRIGDLVRQRDTGEILGAIVHFKLYPREDRTEVHAFIDVNGDDVVFPLGILEPVNITQVINESPASIEVLEKLVKKAGW